MELENRKNPQRNDAGRKDRERKIKRCEIYKGESILAEITTPSGMSDRKEREGSVDDRFKVCRMANEKNGLYF